MVKLKKFIGYVGAWSLYYVGDITSKTFMSWNTLGRFEWPSALYCRFMQASTEVQDWAGNETPWLHIDAETEVNEFKN